MRAIIRTSIILCFVFYVFPANTQSLSENYEEMLVDAVKTGESLKVQALISKLNASVVNKRVKNPNFEKFFDDTTLLHWAVAGYHLEIVKTLLKLGADVNAKDSGGVTPLHYSVTRRQLDTQIREEFDAFGMFEALQSYVDEAVDEEIDEEFNRLLTEVRTLDQINIELGLDYEYSIDLVKILIEAGADVNVKDYKESTPLHYAVGYPEDVNYDVVSLLLEAGANSSAKDKDGQTPLHHAVYSGNVESVSDILEAGADIEEKDYDGNTPLHLALSSVNLVDSFLSEANEMRNRSRGIDFEFSEILLQGRAVEALLEEGADADVKDIEGKAALHYAAMWENENLVQMLIDAGADVNLRDSEINTPLFYAALNNDEQIVKLLRNAGAEDF